MKRISLLPWSEILLPALSITFGMQIVRTLPPYLQYLLGDRFGWNSIQLGLIGLLVFSAGLLTAGFNRWLGWRRLLLLSAGGLGLGRLGIQVWTGDPVGDMLLAIVGTVLFSFFLLTFLVLALGQENPVVSSYRYALAILAGLAFDVALHGLFLTYDLVWQIGFIPLVLTAGLVFIQWAAIRAFLTTIPVHPTPVSDTFFAALPWIAIGPFLFLQLIIFQNQARLTALTSWAFPAAFTWILTSHLLGIGLATLWQPRRIGVILAGLILVVALWPYQKISPIAVALALSVGQISAAVLVTTILIGLGEKVSGLCPDFTGSGRNQCRYPFQYSLRSFGDCDYHYRGV